MIKRGSYKWDVMIALILGLMVLSLSLYFIFQEYFTSDMIDQESCRQSVILRATLPEAEKVGITFMSFKDDFPLKCKTQIYTIDYNDTEKAGKLITDTLAQCWYLFGEGESQIFPAQPERVGIPFTGYGFESYCVPCARVHFSPEVGDFYKKNRIDVSAALDKVMTDITYKVYLSQAFQPSVGVNYIFFDTKRKVTDFQFSGDKFIVDDAETTGPMKTIRNSLTGGIAEVTLPRYINSSNGDILIFFSQVIRSDHSDTFGHNPLLFYFQIDQEPDPFKELGKDFIEAGDWGATMCDQFDGIPA